VGDDPAVGGAAEAVVTQVVGEDVVTGVVQDLIVGHEVDFESVTAGRPVCVPGLKVGWMPDLLKPTGWLAMISLLDPGAGMNQPSSGTPSRAGKVMSS
jgi:hypothetical protein